MSIEALQEVLDHHLVLIQGPPGTGKSSVATAIVSAWARSYKPMLP